MNTNVNIAQLYEQEINFISDKLIKYYLLNQESEYYCNIDFLYDYLKDLDQEYADKVYQTYLYLDQNQAENFWTEIQEKGIFIRQLPFHNKFNINNLAEIYKKYDFIKPDYLSYTDPETNQKIDIEQPIVVGDIYMMRLKHEPFGKFSTRSDSNISIRGMPTKSNSFKIHSQPFSSTPIRTGEQERMNLMISNNIEDLIRFMSCHCSNEEDRINLLKSLINDNPFQVNEIEKSDSKQKTRQILETLLATIGLRLED